MHMFYASMLLAEVLISWSQMLRTITSCSSRRGWLNKPPLLNHNAPLHLLQLLPITQTNASRSRHKKKDRKKNISILLNFG